MTGGQVIAQGVEIVAHGSNCRAWTGAERVIHTSVRYDVEQCIMPEDAMYFFRRTLRIRCILGRSRQWKPHRFVQTILLSYVVLYDNTRGVTRIGTEVLKVPATCKTGDRQNCPPHTIMRTSRPRTRHARGSIIGARRAARAPGTRVAQSFCISL